MVLVPLMMAVAMLSQEGDVVLVMVLWTAERALLAISIVAQVVQVSVV